MVCMRLISLILCSGICTLFTFGVSATPYDSANVPQNAISNGSTPAFNAFARILDRNGIDVSSSFKVKVFHGALNTRTSNGTTIDKINDRRTVLEAVRVVDQCHGANEVFIESHCTPNDLAEGSPQSFVWTCRRMVERWHAQTGVYLGWRPDYLTLNGQCDETDLCVDTTIVKHFATCVSWDYFEDFEVDKEGRVRGLRSGRYFDVAEAHAAITGADQKTHLEAKSMDISAWKSSAALSKASVQSKKCRHCVELETDKLQPSIDSLKVEATLVSAGAVTGILWLSLISG